MLILLAISLPQFYADFLFSLRQLRNKQLLRFYCDFFAKGQNFCQFSFLLNNQKLKDMNCKGIYYRIWQLFFVNTFKFKCSCEEPLEHFFILIQKLLLNKSGMSIHCKFEFLRVELYVIPHNCPQSNTNLSMQKIQNMCYKHQGEQYSIIYTI